MYIFFFAHNNDALHTKAAARTERIHQKQKGHYNNQLSHQA